MGTDRAPAAEDHPAFSNAELEAENRRLRATLKAARMVAFLNKAGSASHMRIALETILAGCDEALAPAKPPRGP